MRSSRIYFFLFRLSRISIHLTVLSGCFLVMSWMVTLDAWSPLGEKETNQVFVPKTSEAARRGYALPDEGNAARVTRGRDDLSVKLLYASASLFALAILILLAGAIWFREVLLSGFETKSIISIFGITLLILAGGAFVGFVAGLFLVFLPTKAFLLIVPLLAIIYLALKWIKSGEIALLTNEDATGYPVRLCYGDGDFGSDKYIEANAVSSYEEPPYRLKVEGVGSLDVKKGAVVVIENGKLRKL